VFDTTPLEELAGILKKFGFVPFDSQVREESIWIASPSDVALWTALKRLVRIIWNWAPDWGQGQSRLKVALTLFRYVVYARHMRRGMDGAGRIEPCRSIDAAFEGLWERTRMGQTLTNVRSAESLAWYVLRNPTNQSFTLLTHRKQDRLVAWVLLKRLPGRQWPETDCWLVIDAWAEGEWRANLLPVLGHALALGRREGILVLRVPHYHPELARVCEEFGLIRRDLRALGYYHRPSPGEGMPDPVTMRISRNMGDYGC
ncbi:MAG: hypothetical protein HQL97_11095, partial [Magnetococcales bacterium]|nr:hypothetical protein [Magnetococcales bacterium]